MPLPIIRTDLTYETWGDAARNLPRERFESGPTDYGRTSYRAAARNRYPEISTLSDEQVSLIWRNHCLYYYGGGPYRTSEIVEAWYEQCYAFKEPPFEPGFEDEETTATQAAS